MVVYQPVTAPQDAYYRGNSFYDERSSVKELEQDFDLEAQRPENKRRAAGAHRISAAARQYLWCTTKIHARTMSSLCITPV